MSVFVILIYNNYSFWDEYLILALFKHFTNKLAVGFNCYGTNFEYLKSHLMHISEILTTLWLYFHSTNLCLRFLLWGGGGNGGNSTPSPSHLYYSNSWLPQHIQVDLKASGQVNISKLDRPDDTLPSDKVNYYW